MNSQKVFMVMPFSNRISNDNFEHHVIPICSDRSLDVRRSDQVFTTNSFHDDIVQEITNANIVVVDITGNNPNVMYELGISHVLKKNRTIIITNSDFNDIPSDFRHMRVIKYDNDIPGAAKFKLEFSQVLDYLLEDSLEKYLSEFEFLFGVFSTTDKWTLMIAIVGLKGIKKPLHLSDMLYFEGRHPKAEVTQSHFNSEKPFEFYIKNQFISIDNGLISLTNKGLLFSRFLEGKGIECCFMNDEFLKEGYVLMTNRLLRKAKRNSEGSV